MKSLIIKLLYILLIFNHISFSQPLWNLKVSDDLIVCVGGDTSISTLYDILETDSLKNDLIYGCAAELLSIYQGENAKDFILDKLRFWINKNDPNFSWNNYFCFQRLAGFLGENSAIWGMDTIINFSDDINLRKNAIGYLAQAGYLEYYDTVKSYFFNQSTETDGILLLGEYGKDDRYKNEVKLLLSKVVQDSTTDLKVYLATKGISKFDSVYAVQLLNERFRNSSGTLRRNLFEYLSILDPNNQMERSRWAIPQEPDENLRVDYIPLIYSDSSYEGLKEYLSPTWINFMGSWLSNETSYLIKVLLIKNIMEFIPQRIDTNSYIEDNLNFLNNLIDSVQYFNWLGDITFSNELKNILTTAKSNLQNGDSLACAVQVKLFQDLVDDVYKDSLNSDPRFVTIEGWKFLYWNAKYILDRLPEIPINLPPGIEVINPAMSLINPGAFTMEVKGTGFTINSTVYFNGSSRATTFISDSVLNAQILSTDVTVAGNYPVWVSDGTTNSDTLVYKVVSTLPQPVRPVLECVRNNGDGTYTAFFGYKNDNSVSVYIPVGNKNKFTPTPQDRGQTRVFEPGRHYKVFTVNFNGSNLVWTLNGRTSTASSNSAPCN